MIDLNSCQRLSFLKFGGKSSKQAPYLLIIQPITRFESQFASNLFFSHFQHDFFMCYFVTIQSLLNKSFWWIRVMSCSLSHLVGNGWQHLSPSLGEVWNWPWILQNTLFCATNKAVQCLLVMEKMVFCQSVVYWLCICQNVQKCWNFLNPSICTQKERVIQSNLKGKNDSLWYFLCYVGLLKLNWPCWANLILRKIFVYFVKNTSFTIFG